MTASISDTIKKLSDSASAKIDLTTTTRQKIRLNCIYKESEAPSFFLVFPPKVLPDTIDTEKICPVSINAGSTTLALNAQIIAIKGDRTLELVGKSSVRPESLREFFRVDTKLYITAEFEPQALGGAIPSWSIEGRTLDLSGSGVLAIFPEEPLSKQRVELSIDRSTARAARLLPTPAAVRQTAVIFGPTPCQAASLTCNSPALISPWHRSTSPTSATWVTTGR